MDLKRKQAICVALILYDEISKKKREKRSFSVNSQSWTKYCRQIHKIK